MKNNEEATDWKPEVIKIGELVKQLMKEQCIAKSKLAEVLGITRQHVPRLLESNSIKLEYLYKLSALFNKPVEYFTSNGRFDSAEGVSMGTTYAGSEDSLAHEVEKLRAEVAILKKLLKEKDNVIESQTELLKIYTQS